MFESIRRSLRRGMTALALAIVSYVVLSWIVFPWWGALIVTSSNTVALWLFVKTAITMEQMAVDSDDLLKKLQRAYDETAPKPDKDDYIH